MSRYQKVSRWFLECGLRLKSGLDLAQSLQPCHKSLRKGVDQILTDISEGKDIHTSIESIHWISEQEKETLKSSDQKQLGETFLYLARNRELNYQNHQAILRAIMGFALLFHIIWGSIYFIHVSVYGESPLFHMICLGLFWFLLPISLFAAYKKSKWCSKPFQYLPYFSGYIKQLQLSRFAFAMEYHIQNNETQAEAIYQSGKISGSKLLLKAAENLKEHLNAGESLWLRIHTQLCFPENFSLLIQEGAQTSDALLAENLNYLGRHHQEEASKAFSKAIFTTLLVIPSVFLLIYIPLLLIMA